MYDYTPFSCTTIPPLVVQLYTFWLYDYTPTFRSNHEANKFTARLLLHHFLSKENMEWLAQYAEFGLGNEQKLALVFVREVGAIDNATYRQLDSSITHARARLEIHKLCNLGFIEKKGQGRNTYYIRTSKVVSLGERLRPQVERLLPLDERLLPLDEKIPPQHGTFGKKIPPQHGTFGKKDTTSAWYIWRKDTTSAWYIWRRDRSLLPVIFTP